MDTNDDLEVIATSRKQIAQLLAKVRETVQESDRDRNLMDHMNQTQHFIQVHTERDKYFDKIIEQQAIPKQLFERDVQIKSLRRANAAAQIKIQNLRKQCAEIELKSMSSRHKLLDDQQAELDRYKQEMSKLVAKKVKDYTKLLENKEKECQEMRDSIKLEAETREKHIKDYTQEQERDLERRKKCYQKSTQGNSDPFAEEDEIHLLTVDEYQPYGKPSESTTKRGGSRKRILKLY